MKNITRIAALSLVFSLGTSSLLSAQDLNVGPLAMTGTWDNPSVFIENHGQFPVLGAKDANVLYAYDNGQEMIYFRRDGFSYCLMSKKPKNEKEAYDPDMMLGDRDADGKNDRRKEEVAAIFKRTDVYVTWENASSSVEVTGEEQVSQYFNYAVKNDNTESTIDENHGFRKLIYHNLYNNIDVQFEFHPNGGIKYTLIVHPGGDVSQVKMLYTGAKKISIDKAGEVTIETSLGDIIDHAPTTYYQSDASAVIPSAFAKSGSEISFTIGEYDHAKDLLIDPWQQTAGLGFSNSNKVWECEHDASANSYFWGGDTPCRLKKFNSAGTIQWTYNSTWDTANFWIGTLLTDNAGNSFITGGSNGEIRKLNTAGTSQWYNNPNGAFGPLYEYWHMAFNCDQTSLLIGGMRMPNPFSTSQFRGVTVTINMGSGAVTGFTVVGYIAGLNIKEVRTICTCPSGGYYFLTLDSIGYVTAANVLTWKSSSGYNFSYGNPSYAIQGNMGVSAIRANANAIYTMNGTTLHKRNTANGAIISSVAIPGGIGSSSAFGNTMGCSGLDLDSCGNVYVGSGNSIVKYDANLNQLSTQSTPGVVYDVSVTKNGEVVACGNQWMGTYNMGNCNPMQAICVTSTLSASSTQTNVSCFGSCTGTATANPTGGTSPYTYSWAPSGGNAATANSLCAGGYTCTITDAASATTTVSVNITQPATAVSATQSQVNLVCNAACNGSASVVASGGTGPYTYSWSPSGGTGATASSLCQGNYTCTITDANGCTLTKSFAITQPSALSATSSSTNVTCNASCNGTASVNASGGSPSYTYAWSPSGGTGSSASSLCANNYTCTITDANGCTTTQSFAITQPTALTASATSTPTGCAASTGTATASASGGTGAYTYAWSPSGGNAATANNLAAGSYSCTITDANGCSTVAITTVSSSGGPTVSVQSQSDELCNGGATGSASINASGNGPFTYAWSPSGGNASSASNLTAGSYTCTITDANGCVSAQSLTITEPTAITASATSTPTGCAASTGTATASASGGTGAYTYAWTPSGGNAATAINLAAGTYSCTITDANGCSTITSTVVTSSGGPTTSVQSTTDELCFGNTNGAGTVSATGNGPFTYAWSPSGGNAATATNLAAGTYTVAITDANGCVSSQIVAITEPTQLASNPTEVDATCGNSNGSADAVASGGTPGYTYLWSNNATTNSITGIQGGSYSVTVTDANGCTTTSTVNVGNSGAPTVTLASSADPACFGGSTGSATVSATGGSSPYTYAWSPAGGTNASATNLAAGTYTVTVTGSDGCAQTQTVTLTQPTQIASTTGSTAENCGGGDGTAFVNASGGTGPYTYMWSNNATNDSISGLNAGLYGVTITDANGCTSTANVNVASASTATASASASTTNISSGGSTTLTGTGNGTWYSWSPSSTVACPTCQSTTASPTVTTTYTLTVTDSLGCTATDTITIIVDVACGDIWVPTAFSPNGDHENDVLYVRGNCIEVLTFNVYNRWGELVFSTNDVAHGWDGKWRDKDCEAAVFTYYLRATLNNGNEFEQQGNITLIK